MNEITVNQIIDKIAEKLGVATDKVMEAFSVLVSDYIIIHVVQAIIWGCVAIFLLVTTKIWYSRWTKKIDKNKVSYPLELDDLKFICWFGTIVGLLSSAAALFGGVGTHIVMAVGARYFLLKELLAAT